MRTDVSAMKRHKVFLSRMQSDSTADEFSACFFPAENDCGSGAQGRGKLVRKVSKGSRYSNTESRNISLVSVITEIIYVTTHCLK